ncbi:MAG: zinc ribbon domain-containing protein [Chloroflexi bacterium HGW-Chloroflexi-1]|nr:MAG: zinc ribbon domain-containing protein [Chloroflexi bacterium HGW-Chloroflexi-1]
MPLYEYRCASCQAFFEALRPMCESDSSISCPRCASLSTRRQISTFAAISKSAGGGSRLVASSQSGDGCAACRGGSCATCGH